MPRITVNVSEETEAWIESEADALGVSKARAGGHCIEVMQDTVDHISLHRSDVDGPSDDGDRPNDRGDELVELVERLEDRLEELENTVATEAPEPRETRVESAPTQTSQPDERDETHPLDDVAEKYDADLDEPASTYPSDAVGTIVEQTAASWDDTSERLAARKAAAAAVLQYALDTGEAVGKTDAIENFHTEYSVEGQNDETWWRKNVRPVLQEVGQYSQGKHGYVVDREAVQEATESADPYDPTDEF